jgi:hypothetical protein
MGCNSLDFLSFDELIEEEGRGLADGLGFFNSGQVNVL